MNFSDKLRPVIELADCVGTTVEGVYRFYPGARTKASNGDTYIPGSLEDGTGSIPAVVFDDNYDGPDPTAPATLHVTTAVHQISTGLIAKILAARKVPTAPVDAPKSGPPVREIQARLRAVRASITEPLLTRFVTRVGGDPQIGFLYLTLPASRRHHHAHRHGLVLHSIEVAEQMQRLRHIPRRQREVLTVGALYHDIGKIWTLGERARVDRAADLDHDQLTLEILASHLRWLSQNDSVLANDLRFILTRHFERPGCDNPLAVALDLLKMADRMSAQSARR